MSLTGGRKYPVPSTEYGEVGLRGGCPILTSRKRDFDLLVRARRGQPAPGDGHPLPSRFITATRFLDSVGEG